MESKITKKGNFEKLIEVDVPADELTPHFDNVYRKYQKNIKLQGFRKGKVPISMIKKLYGDEIKGQAIEEIVQSVFRDVIDRESLKLVAPGKVEDVDYEPEKGLKFKARVEVVPEIELKSYRGLSVERETYQVDEEDIIEALADVREQMAVMEPVETEAEEGHFVLADIQQIDSTGVPIIGRKYEGRLLELNIEDSTKELAEQLIGAKAGDSRRVELPTQENPHSGDPGVQRNGKEYFNVQIKEVKSKQLPELDDELAKDTGKFETLEELKQDIKEKLTKQAQINARNHLRRRIIDEIVKKNSFDLPGSMIENYLNVLVEGAKKDSSEADEEEIRQHYRPSAIWNLKWQLIKDKLQEIESFTVTEQDKERFISRIAEERGIDEKQVLSTLNTKKSRERLDEDLIEEKILNFLEENAKIKDKKITRKDIEKAQQLALK